MQSTAPSGCWLPVPHGCRWSAVRRRHRSLGPLQWTTNSSLSRSSSALTTSPRLQSSWSPSPLVRRSSDPNKCMDGWRGKRERERTDQCMGGLRGMGGDSRRRRKRGGKYDHTKDGRTREGGVIERMMGKGRVWNMHGKGIRRKRRESIVE